MLDSLYRPVPSRNDFQSLQRLACLDSASPVPKLVAKALPLYHSSFLKDPGLVESIINSRSPLDEPTCSSREGLKGHKIHVLSKERTEITQTASDEFSSSLDHSDPDSQREELSKTVGPRNSVTLSPQGISTNATEAKVSEDFGDSILPEIEEPHTSDSPVLEEPKEAPVPPTGSELTDSLGNTSRSLEIIELKNWFVEPEDSRKGLKIYLCGSTDSNTIREEVCKRIDSHVISVKS